MNRLWLGAGIGVAIVSAAPLAHVAWAEDLAPTPAAEPITREWPQWGGDSHRNNTPVGVGIPTDWDVGSFDFETGEWDPSSSRNIKWVSRLGSQTYGNCVIAGGKALIGTNNSGGWLPRYPASVDLGCLIAFDAETGAFLWQHSSEKLKTGRVHDWPLQGICCAPLVEGGRLWFVTSRGEVRCLDLDGYYDRADDGPVVGELAKQFAVTKGPPRKGDPDHFADTLRALEAGRVGDFARGEFERVGLPLSEKARVTATEAGYTILARVGEPGREFRVRKTPASLTFYSLTTPDDRTEADVLWVFDMMRELGVSQHNMASCSITSIGDTLLVNTSNGLDESHINLPAPDAPSFIALDKNTGAVLWTDKSPGSNILHGQWSSPACAVVTMEDGSRQAQAVFAGGDGWVYAFDPAGDGAGGPKELWRFDANPKQSKWVLGGAGTRNNLIATPVFYENRFYVAVGQDPEHGEGEGHLWCLDPRGSGDVSPELAFNAAAPDQTIPAKRIQAVVPEEGDLARPNPFSRAVWHYATQDQDGDGEIDDYLETMHRSCGTVCIKDGVLYIADFSGIFHCLDASTGDVHWTYDMEAPAWGSPLIVEDKVYIGDEEGDVSIFRHSADRDVAMRYDEDEDWWYPSVNTVSMESSVYSTPIVANNTLYISNRTHLFAIAAEED
ncbi:MAG: PQQ-binding-like beta-propeller repeat protein [Planctomycetota bacterium]